jgi:hypothetical protein
MLVGARFPSWFNAFLGNAFVLMIEVKLACIRFPIWCNVVFCNALVHVLEGKLAHTSFP